MLNTPLTRTHAQTRKRREVCPYRDNLQSGNILKLIGSVCIIDIVNLT